MKNLNNYRKCWTTLYSQFVVFRITDVQKKWGVLSLCFACICCLNILSVNAQQVRVVTENLPPFQIVENNKVVAGSSFKIVAELLKRANIQSPTEVLPWARAFRIASTEPNVIIFSITRSEERENQFHWLLKLHTLNHSFYALKGRPELDVSSTEDLLSRSVVAVTNSYEANALKEFGFTEGLNLVQTNNYATAWQMVKKGRADYIYADEFVGNPVFNAMNITPDLFDKKFRIGGSLDLYVAASIETASDTLELLRHHIAQMKSEDMAAASKSY